MPNNDETDPPLVDSSDDVSPEILRELSAAFGNTPTEIVAPSDPTPVNPIPSLTEENPTISLGEPTAPTTASEVAESSLRIGTDRIEDDIVYLDDETFAGPQGLPIPSGEPDEVRVVAGSFFVRAIRRFDPRRRRGRRALGWLAVSIAGAVTAIGLIVVATSPVLSVSEIRVEGATYTSQKTLDKVTELLKGKTILTLDTGPAIEALENDPWVREATIETKLPRTVIVDIAERTPRVWFRSTDERYRVIDEEGRVLAVLKGQPTEYPEVTGLAPNVAPGTVAPDEFTAAAQLSMSLPPELENKVARFGVTTAGDITMSLQSGALIKFGRPENMRQKLISVVVVMRRPDADKLVSIDVSADEVVVK